MIPVTTFADKRVAVFGLARSGIVSAEALVAGGATVACWDDGEAGRAAAEKAGLPLVDLREADWSQFAALVLAPGVPLTHPQPHWTVEKAKAAGVEIIGDIELFFRERAKRWPDCVEADAKCPVVAITGTNGKSTTTALVAHILRSAGKDVQMGGNIGVGVLALDPLAEGRHYVIEMSSFQIDLTPTLTPTVGVLLNITPDHLDRHGTMQNYAAVKGRAVSDATTAVIGEGDGACIEISHELNRNRRSFVSFATGDGAEICAKDGRVISGATGRVLADIRAIRSLRGGHNTENAAAAMAALGALGLPFEAIAAAMKSFPGLEHRLEELGRVGKVIVVNDSKGTNADSTEKALLSFPGDIYWIAGGVPKEGGIEPLRPLFPRVAKAYLIGECAADFAKTLGSAVPHEISGDLKTALANAARDAQRSSAAEPVILLSPACASYDQYKSFEQRGDHFKALAAQLPGFQPLVSSKGHV